MELRGWNRFDLRKARRFLLDVLWDLIIAKVIHLNVLGTRLVIVTST